MESGEASQSGPSRKRHRERSPRRSLACISCRKIKMKCVGGEEGTGMPCRRCRNHNRECIWVESKRGRRPKSVVPEGADGPSINRRPSDSTLSPHTTPERLPPAPGNTTYPPQPMLGTHFVSTPTSYSSYAIHPSGLRNERPEEQSRDKQYEATVLPLMEMVDCNDSRQLLESRMKLVEQMTGTYSASTDQGEIVTTPAASTTFTHHPSSSDTHPAERRNRLQSLPSTVLNPLGLLAEASLRGSDEPQSEAPTPKQSPLDNHSQLPGQAGGTTPDMMGRQRRRIRHLPGVGNARYFELKPKILKLLSWQHVQELFSIYFDNMHKLLPVLHPALHTPISVMARSEFLFTTVIVIASRLHTPSTNLHSEFLTLMKDMISVVFSRGIKSLEIIQAYLLLSFWPLEAEERFEHSRTWLSTGIAIRMATDLNLFRRKSINTEDSEDAEFAKQEIKNRERCWLWCFALDRSWSVQLGKPYTLRADEIVRRTREWIHEPFSQPNDVLVCALLDIQRHVSDIVDILCWSDMPLTSSGLLANFNYNFVLQPAQEHMVRIWDYWKPVLEKAKSDSGVPYEQIARFYYHHNSLVICSFGLQNALENNALDLTAYFCKVYDHASGVLELVQSAFVPNSLLNSVMSSQLIMITYAALSMLKLTRLETRPLQVETKDVLQRILSVADALQASGSLPQHPPRLYATLLRRLVDSRARELQQQHQQKTQISEAATMNGTAPTAVQLSLGTMSQGYQRPAWVPQEEPERYTPNQMTLAPEVDLTVPSRQQSPGLNRLSAWQGMNDTQLMPMQNMNTGLAMSTMVPSTIQPVPTAGYDFSNFPMEQNLGDFSGMNQIDFGGSFLGTQFIEGFMDSNFVNGSMQNMGNPSSNIDVNWLPMEFPKYTQSNIPPEPLR
ncbi:hypothetical protein NCC49_006537 [Naganishia albida]|nr:hypothetical protein NCC49_006537 [Naganishia albida]